MRSAMVSPDQRVRWRESLCSHLLSFHNRVRNRVDTSATMATARLPSLVNRFGGYRSKRGAIFAMRLLLSLAVLAAFGIGCESVPVAYFEGHLHTGDTF